MHSTQYVIEISFQVYFENFIYIDMKNKIIILFVFSNIRTGHTCKYW